jgi:hypothetical protein
MTRKKIGFDKLREEFHMTVEKAKEDRKPKSEWEELMEIEGRFYSWSYLSIQQEEDITWLIKTLKEKIENE